MTGAGPAADAAAVAGFLASEAHAADTAEGPAMEMFELLETIATTSLAALAIAAGTVVAIGGAVLGAVVIAGTIAARRARRA